MAHLITGYAGHEHIQSADQGSFNAAFFGGGQYVMESGNQLEASIIDNNTVRVLDGDLLMYGRHVRVDSDTYEDMTIDTGIAGQKRIDLICMTYEKNTLDGTESAFLEVIKGSGTEGTAQVPDYTDGNILNGASKNQMPLYQVNVDGVVLASITPLFTTIPTYKTLAERYAAQFEATITALKTANILDDIEEIEANTQSNMLSGALALKEHLLDKGNPHGVTAIQTGALTPANVVDSLNSDKVNMPLSAKQGKVLNEKIVELNEWEDITDECTFNTDAISSTTTKVFRNANSIVVKLTMTMVSTIAEKTNQLLLTLPEEYTPNIDMLEFGTSNSSIGALHLRAVVFGKQNTVTSYQPGQIIASSASEWKNINGTLVIPLIK